MGEICSRNGRNEKCLLKLSRRNYKKGHLGDSCRKEANIIMYAKEIGCECVE